MDCIILPYWNKICTQLVSFRIEEAGAWLIWWKRGDNDLASIGRTEASISRTQIFPGNIKGLAKPSLQDSASCKAFARPLPHSNKKALAKASLAPQCLNQQTFVKRRCTKKNIHSNNSSFFYTKWLLYKGLRYEKNSKSILDPLCFF